MALHEEVADGLVAVAEGKDEEEGRLENKIAEIDGGDDHAEHKGDFEDGAEGGVAGGPEGVVLCPVAHADNRGCAVDDEKPCADAEGLARKAEHMEQRGMQADEQQADKGDETAAEVHDPYRPLIGFFVIAGADFFADEDARGI